MKPTTYQGNSPVVSMGWVSEWVSEWMSERASEWFNAMSANEAIFTARLGDFYRIINNIL